MNESIKLLDKAARAIQAAERLAAEGLPEFAVGRAYYAMFYVAEAVLKAKGLRYSKHSGVHAAFGERVVKTGEMEPRYTGGSSTPSTDGSPETTASMCRSSPTRWLG